EHRPDVDDRELRGEPGVLRRRPGRAHGAGVRHRPDQLHRAHPGAVEPARTPDPGAGVPDQTARAADVAGGRREPDSWPGQPPVRNMSSSAGRMIEAAPGPSSWVMCWSSPRTTATGRPAVLPRTRSAAAAISSATLMM